MLYSFASAVSETPIEVQSDPLKEMYETGGGGGGGGTICNGLNTGMHCQIKTGIFFRLYGIKYGKIYYMTQSK